jgi:hypothetical protein
VRFVSEAGSIRYEPVRPGTPGFPTNPEQLQARSWLLTSLDTPDSLADIIEMYLANPPTPITPVQHAALDRLAALVPGLRALGARYSGRVLPWME